MKLARSLSLALAIAAIGAPAWAAQHDQNKGHPPAGAASGPASKAMSGKSSAHMDRMDTQMKAMREMHDKMMAAKTPEDRNALMAEHKKAMEEGMTMMKGMSPDGMSGMGGMKGGMKADMDSRHQMMEKRMEMMQSMMQMMMDRLPAAPAK